MLVGDCWTVNPYIYHTAVEFVFQRQYFKNKPVIPFTARNMWKVYPALDTARPKSHFLSFVLCLKHRSVWWERWEYLLCKSILPSVRVGTCSFAFCYVFMCNQSEEKGTSDQKRLQSHIQVRYPNLETHNCTFKCFLMGCLLTYSPVLPPPIFQSQFFKWLSVSPLSPAAV